MVPDKAWLRHPDNGLYLHTRPIARSDPASGALDTEHSVVVSPWRDVRVRLGLGHRLVAVRSSRRKVAQRPREAISRVLAPLPQRTRGGHGRRHGLDSRKFDPAPPV